MIQFNKLETDKNNNLIVDVQVKDKDYYENVYLGDLYIDTQDTYRDNSPSDKSLKISLKEITEDFEKDKCNSESSLITVNNREGIKNFIAISVGAIQHDGIKKVKYVVTLTYKEKDLNPTDIYYMRFYGILLSDYIKIKCDSVDISETKAVFTAILDDFPKNINYIYYITIEAAASDGSGGDINIFSRLKQDNNLSGIGLKMYRYIKTESYPKSKILEIPKTAYPSIDTNILYVYAKTSDNSVPAADTPCGEDNQYTLGVVVNNNIIYNKGISYIRELGNTCNTPKGFISYILEYNAFNLALKTKNYSQANIYWNKFFKSNLTTLNTKNCGCNK